MTPEQARDVLFDLTGEQGRAAERLIAELDRLQVFQETWATPLLTEVQRLRVQRDAVLAVADEMHEVIHAAYGRDFSTLASISEYVAGVIRRALGVTS